MLFKKNAACFMWRFFMMCKPEPAKVCDKRRVKTAILSPFLVAMTICG